MKLKDIRIWYASVGALCLCLIPFFAFMVKLQLPYLAVCLLCLTAASVFYMYATKRITHPTCKYTVFQAMKFAQTCIQAGMKNMQQIKDNKQAFMDLGKCNEWSEKLDYNQLTEMFQLGVRMNLEVKRGKK